MKPWTHKPLRWLKTFPPAFDAARWCARRLGYRPPLYLILQRLARRMPEVRFVQIGANDGISSDPIREFVIGNRGWRGVLIEPLPTMFPLLKKNYGRSSNGRLRFVQAAVSDRSGTMSIWKIRDDRYGRYPDALRGCATFDRDTLLKHCPGDSEIGSDLEEVRVPCVTYSELLRSENVDRVDLLVVDVEGHEAKVFGDLELSGPLRPAVVIYEAVHLSGPDDEQIWKRFEAGGYVCRRVGIDVVAVSSELAAHVLG